MAAKKPPPEDHFKELSSEELERLEIFKALRKIRAFLLEKKEKLEIWDLLNNSEKDFYEDPGLDSWEERKAQARKMFDESPFHILRTYPTKVQAVEFLGSEWREYLHTKLPIKYPKKITESQFRKIFVKEGLKWAFKKGTYLAWKHWEEYGSFDKGAGKSEYKRFENVIKGILTGIGLLSVPAECAEFLRDFKDQCKQHKEAVFMKMEENPVFSWAKFYARFESMDLCQACAVLFVELDPEIWHKRIATASHQKNIENRRRAGKITSPKKGDGRRKEGEKTKKELSKIRELVIKRNPGISPKDLRAKCKEKFPKSDSTFDKLWPAINRKPEN